MPDTSCDNVPDPERARLPPGRMLTDAAASPTATIGVSRRTVPLRRPEKRRR
jgi:hypothetical protein